MPDPLEFKQPHDYLVRATAAAGAIRAFAVTSRATVEEARRLRSLSKTTTAALGRTLTVAAMMGPMMKGADDRLTLVFEGDGPIRTVVASENPMATCAATSATPRWSCPSTRRATSTSGAPSAMAPCV